MGEVKRLSGLIKEVMAMDTRRKDDLLTQLVMIIFDNFYEDDLDRVEEMMDQIENIAGVEIYKNLQSLFS